MMMNTTTPHTRVAGTTHCQLRSSHDALDAALKDGSLDFDGLPPVVGDVAAMAAALDASNRALASVSPSPSAIVRRRCFR
jgi:hypothetical protein